MDQVNSVYETSPALNRTTIAPNERRCEAADTLPDTLETLQAQTSCDYRVLSQVRTDLFDDYPLLASLWVWHPITMNRPTCRK